MILGKHCIHINRVHETLSTSLFYWCVCCVTQPSSPPPAGKLTAYDTDGDGDFDVEDAKVLLGKSHFYFYSFARLSPSQQMSE